MSDDLAALAAFTGVDAAAAIQRVVDSWLRETGNPATAASKRADLRCLASFLGLPARDPESLRRAATRLLGHGFGEAQDLVRQWVVWMSEDRYSAKTRSRRVSHIRGLVRVAGEFGLSWQLRIRVKSGRTSREVTGPDPDLVYNRIRDLAGKADRCSIRDCAVLIVFITLGLRRHAVVGLRAEDYLPASDTQDVLRSQDDTLAGTLVLAGKNEGDEKHTRSLPRVASIAIDRWLVVRGDRPGHLFCSMRSLSAELPELPSLAPSSIYRLCKRRGLGRPHGLRHSSATKLARDGHDIWALKAHLRHKTTDTVGVYVDQAADLPGQTAAHLAVPLEGLFDSST